MIFFDRSLNRLVFFQKRATPKFWDQIWKNQTQGMTLLKKFDLVVVPTTKKYLKKGNKILEGGCGHGSYVISLNQSGYKATGIDYAKKTITILQKTRPELDFKVGDVRNLPFPMHSFHGYWSLGVIEHFYQGYEKIVSEMDRVLKRNGYAFVTFPYMSPLRKLKAKLGMYREWRDGMSATSFYQFALNKEKVIMDVTQHGFRLVEQKPYDGVGGLRKEVSFLHFILNPLTKYSSKFLLIAGVSFLLSKLLEKFTSHTILLVFKKV